MKPKLGGWKLEQYNSNIKYYNDINYKFSFNEQTIINDIVDLRKYCSPVENQSSLGSCAANATVGALEFLQIKNGLKYIDISRLFLYYNARLLMREQEKDEGSYIELNMKSLTLIGSCNESTWKYDISNVFIRPSWVAYKEAYSHKISSYYKIIGTYDKIFDNIKDALRKGLVVVFGMTVDENYINHFNKNIISLPDKLRINPGGHAQIIVGYNDIKKYFIVRNSWGTNWGDNGYAYVPYDYLKISNANDFWVPYLEKK